MFIGTTKQSAKRDIFMTFDRGIFWEKFHWAQVQQIGRK